MLRRALLRLYAPINLDHFRRAAGEAELDPAATSRLADITKFKLTYSDWKATPLLKKPVLEGKKLLVLDLDETLGTGWEPWKLRPHALEFMKVATERFDVVFWTRSPEWAATIKIKNLGFDVKDLRHPLLAGWSSEYLDGSTKDLKRLGHPMDQVLLVDDDKDHVTLQPRSVWKIPAWYGGKADATDALKVGVEILNRVADAPTVQHVLDPFLASSPEAHEYLVKSIAAKYTATPR